MGQPVVQFEVMGKDGEKLRSYYSELFDWKFESPGEGVDSDYHVTPYEANKSENGMGIGGGIGTAPEGYDGHATFYVWVPDVEAALARAEELGGSRMMGPDQVMEDLTIGLFRDPEGNTIGLVNMSGQN